jgi:alanine-glyoxylate transaminase/serine-glyoxylate transaminase/serine-pyruvate transaminase
MLQEEGLENAWQRHATHHQALRAGLEAMGINFVVAEQDRLPQLNAVTIPEGADDATVRGKLLQDYNLEIGAGLGALAGKVWRIGLMGSACNMKNIEYCLDSLDEVLTEMGAKIHSAVAVDAAKAAFEQYAKAS